jgi:hypothetical protein
MLNPESSAACWMRMTLKLTLYSKTQFGAMTFYAQVLVSERTAWVF